VNVITERFNYCPTDQWAEMVHWCEQNLDQCRRWDHHYPNFYFVAEHEYIMFLLRWGSGHENY
jgi:hypothetical protein